MYFSKVMLTKEYPSDDINSEYLLLEPVDEADFKRILRFAEEHDLFMLCYPYAPEE